MSGRGTRRREGGPGGRDARAAQAADRDRDAAPVGAAHDVDEPAGASLRLRGVAAAPGGTVVLREVDLDVAPGSTTAVIGPSGAGKTTLLRVVAGLEPAAAGTVTLGGRDLTRVPAHRRGIGVVFQEPRLFPDRTLAQNVAFGPEMAGVDEPTRRARAAELLDRVGLGGTADRPVTGLSGGEQQRVNLARALALDPVLLLLDEPLAAVDPDRREELLVLLRELTADVTTLHVTHARAEAAELGDDLAVVVEGRLVQHAPVRRIFTEPANATVARLVGATNVLRGRVDHGAFRVAGGRVDVGGPDGDADVVVRPEQVRVGSGPHTATVDAAHFRGTHVRLELRLDDGATLLADVPPGEAPSAGTTTRFALQQPWRLPTV